MRLETKALIRLYDVNSILSRLKDKLAPIASSALLEEIEKCASENRILIHELEQGKEQVT